MHVLDGICPPATLAVGFAAAGLLTAATLPALARASAPRVAVLTSAFFASSLLAFPVGPSSVHLSLLGVTGIVLGRAAFPAVLVGLALQRLLFGHGGLTTLGVNATTMGCGALVAGGIWHLGRSPSLLRAGVASGVGTGVSLLLYSLALLSAGEGLRSVAFASFALHAPVLVIEIFLGVALVRFLSRVQPELLGLDLDFELEVDPDPGEPT
jgi:cobalt/nickel transport system permease protein